MNKILGLLAITGLVLLSPARMASASSNLPNGTVLTGTGTNLALGGIISCHSTVNGTIFNRPTGQGVHGVIDTATFSGCNPAGTAAVETKPPWTLDLGIATNGGQTWDGAVTDANFDLNMFGLQCSYAGSFGVLYENATMQLTLSGSVTRQAGSVLCPETLPLTGIYHIVPTLTIS
jgi:hypothetical protein